MYLVIFIFIFSLIVYQIFFEPRPSSLELLKNKMNYLEELAEYSKNDEAEIGDWFSKIQVFSYISNIIVYVGEMIETLLFDLYYRLYLGIKRIVFY